MKKEVGNCNKRLKTCFMAAEYIKSEIENHHKDIMQA